MTYSVTFDDATKCLVGIFTGLFDAEAAEQYTNEAIRVATGRHVRCVLNDMRGAEIELSLPELLTVLVRAENAFDAAGTVVKRAIIAEPETDVMRFAEKAIRARGSRVGVFADMREGVAWLDDDLS